MNVAFTMNIYWSWTTKSVSKALMTLKLGSSDSCSETWGIIARGPFAMKSNDIRQSFVGVDT